MINQNFVILGALLLCVGSASYLVDTLRGRIQPNKVTWLLWAVAPLMAFAAQVSEGVGITSLTTFATGFLPALIFIATFFNKQAVWRLSRLDVVCGVLSVAGILLWYVTSDGNLAIVFAMLADFLAAVPTLLKSYQDPKSENDTLFWFGIGNSGIGLLVIDTWDFATYGFVVYLLVMNVLLASLIRFEPKRLLQPASV